MDERAETTAARYAGGSQESNPGGRPGDSSPVPAHSAAALGQFQEIVGGRLRIVVHEVDASVQRRIEHMYDYASPGTSFKASEMLRIGIHLGTTVVDRSVMEKKSTFRRARAEERSVLDEMTLAGIRYWGHHLAHPDAYQGLADSLRKEAGPENYPVFVLEAEGQVLGFFELRDRGDHVELLRMFLRTELIGKGFGKRLWTEAINRASESHDRMLIMSDPKSRGFYEAMGATLESEVEVSPGFRLGKYWYQLRPPRT